PRRDGREPRPPHPGRAAGRVRRQQGGERSVAGRRQHRPPAPSPRIPLPTPASPATANPAGDTEPATKKPAKEHIMSNPDESNPDAIAVLEAGRPVPHLVCRDAAGAIEFYR